MPIIDCAFDNELAQELATYMIKHNYNLKLDDSLIQVNEDNVKNILESFIRQTRKNEYSINQVEQM